MKASMSQDYMNLCITILDLGYLQSGLQSDFQAVVMSMEIICDRYTRLSTLCIPSLIVSAY